MSNFSFVYIKKVDNMCLTHVRRSVAFRQHMWLTKVVEIKFPPYYLMCLDIIFLLG